MVSIGAANTSSDLFCQDRTGTIFRLYNDMFLKSRTILVLIGLFYMTCLIKRYQADRIKLVIS